MEIQVSRRFPRTSIFVEKPLSSGPPVEVEGVATWFAGHENFVVVGYMSRYLKSSFTVGLGNVVVQYVKKIIQEKGLVVASTNFLYQAAYAAETKGKSSFSSSSIEFYWSKRLASGPIVEQATHLCISS